MGILDKFHLLLDSKNLDIRKEIYWGLSNILASSIQIIQLAFNHEIFEKMMNIYQYEDYNVFLFFRKYYFFSKKKFTIVHYFRKITFFQRKIICFSIKY